MALCDLQTYSSSMSDSSDASDYSTDSEEDPTFDILEETRSSFSALSVERKSNRIAKEKDDDMVIEPNVLEMIVPDLDEKDQKSYEIIQRIIEDGQVQRLKVDQCKIYLRKHGLRLTGTKDILIQRIKEHVNILNGAGKKKYPPSSFVVNCKGDACIGDVVLFEQNVYEMFSIASRSANGPPCGTRVIAGRIVKESYGAAKQQHTFSIEVLWSKGEKPLPPLHPLLIKGRNLYRLKTMRQKWEDERERTKILSEKHARGCVARSKRDTRVQQREMRKILKSNRVSETKEGTRKQKINYVSTALKNLASQPPQQAEHMQNTTRAQFFTKKATAPLNANIHFDRLNIQRQPLTSMNGTSFAVPSGLSSHEYYSKSKHSSSSGLLVPNNEHSTLGSNTNQLRPVPEGYAYPESIEMKAFHYGNFMFNPFRGPGQIHDPSARLMNCNAAEDLVQSKRPENSKLCRYYAQGRCYYGQNCKFLHQR